MQQVVADGIGDGLRDLRAAGPIEEGGIEAVVATAKTGELGADAIDVHTRASVGFASVLPMISAPAMASTHFTTST